MKNYFNLLVVALALGVIFGDAPANATSYTYNLSSIFGGFNPGGTAPWLTATINDGGGTGSVTVTMSVSSSLPSGEFVSDVFFNVDPTINPANLSFSNSSGQAAASITHTTGGNCCNADGGGLYDIDFGFETANNSNRFTAGESSVYTITATGLTAGSFLFASTVHGGNGTWGAAAHIQGIANTSGGQTCSVFIGSQEHGGSGSGSSSGDCGQLPPAEVPEPSVLLLLGVGLIAVGGVARRLTRRD